MKNKKNKKKRTLAPPGNVRPNSFVPRAPKGTHAGEGSLASKKCNRLLLVLLLLAPLKVGTGFLWVSGSRDSILLMMIAPPDVVLNTPSKVESNSYSNSCTTPLKLTAAGPLTADAAAYYYRPCDAHSDVPVMGGTLLVHTNSYSNY